MTCQACTQARTRTENDKRHTCACMRLHGKGDVQEGQEHEAEQDGKNLGEEDAREVQQGVVARGHGQVEYGFLQELLLPYRVKADSGKK